MFKIEFFIALGLCICSLAASTKTIDSHLSSADLERLENVFNDGVSSNDIQSIYYGSLHVKEVLKKYPTICQKVADLHKDSKMNDFEKNFYLINIFKKLSCPTPISEPIQSAVTLKKDFTNTQEMFFNYLSSKALGFQVTDDTKTQLIKNIQTILKKDDSIVSLGHAFHLAAELGTIGQPIADWIEGAFAQADEIDRKMLQFEGGLSVTALVLNGAFKLTTALRKAAPITEEQTHKFVAYLLSRRSVQVAKGAHVLIEALNVLAASKVAPICIQLIGNGQIQPDSPNVNVKIVDLLGKPVSPAVSSVTATVTSKQSSTAAVSKQALTAKSSDKTVFALDLTGAKLTRGAYDIQLTADQYTQTVSVKILGKVKVKLLEIGVGEIDSTSALKKQTVDYPSKLSDELNADAQQKVILRAVLVDETTGSPMAVHQAFIRLENKKTNDEIIFVAEQDTTKAYKFDMDVGARGIDFGHKSGAYSLELIVGDASLSNSFKWHIADIQFKFNAQPKVSSNNIPIRTSRPEIIHQFREPEKRPARFVSDLFTGLCILPLVVLFVLWGKLRVNVGDFPFTLSAIGFHLGLGAILSLFCVFFWQLNMFDTIRYLLPIALVTFFFGNRLLRSIAAKKSA